MTPGELQQTTDHRPWALPQSRWKYYQEWNRAIFLHWPVDPKLLRPHIHEGLELDLFEEHAWISIVAFDMNRVKMRNTPVLPPTSEFPELNIRTYVHYKGKQGVYFLSVEAGKPLAAFLARSMTAVPYRYSKMERNDQSFSSENTRSNEQFKLLYKKGSQLAAKSKLDLWLTERYGAFQDKHNKIHDYDVHHIEWPLYDVSIEQLELNYPTLNHLFNGAPEKAHYSTGVQVIAWDACID